MAHCDETNSIHLEQKPASLNSYTAVQKFEISTIFLKKLLLFSKYALNWPSDSKYTYNVTKYIKSMLSSELSINK